MLFWAFILAFVLGILYYNFYPRTDYIRVVDKPVAETAILAFINSHQTAKNMVYNIVETADGTVIDLRYITDMAQVKKEDIIHNKAGIFEKQTDVADKVGHIRSVARNSAITGITADRLKGIESVVACLKIPDINYPQQKELTFDCKENETTDFVITYMDQPTWWNDDIQKRELWRSAILRRTKGSDECGVLYPRAGAAAGVITGLKRYDETSKYVLDNSQRFIVSIPKEITANLESYKNMDMNGYLFCITPIKNIKENAEKRLKINAFETTEPVK